jgi:hypothetical protein
MTRPQDDWRRRIHEGAATPGAALYSAIRHDGHTGADVYCLEWRVLRPRQPQSGHIVATRDFSEFVTVVRYARAEFAGQGVLWAA